MRIATWNLDRCPSAASARGEVLAKQMVRVEADVWVLTESFRGFSPGPGYRLVASSVDAPDREAIRGECWVAVWARLELPAEPVELTADRERSAAARLRGDLILVGTVLPWLADRRDPVLRGKAAFLAWLGLQAAEWRELLEVSGKLCVAGDFNQDLLPVGHYYGSADGRKALGAALTKAKLECLTSGADDPLSRSPGLACIDHICVSGLRPRSRPCSSAWPEPGTLSRRLTDHYCIWADVE